MAYQTTAERSGIPRVALVLESQSLHDPLDPAGRPVAFAPLAIILVLLGFLFTGAGSFYAGRMVEQRSQLGYLIAAAPALDDLQNATRRADSIAMQFMLRWNQLPRSLRASALRRNR